MTPALPTVAIVDDAPDVRAVVRARLRMSRRFEVVGEGADGREAVELAKRLTPALMLLDVSMPEVDGLEALPRILEVSPRTRVVLFSGFEEKGLAERARLLGASDFIEKSTALDVVVQRLLDLLDEEHSPEAPAASAVPSEESRVLGDHLERFREVFDEAAIGMATMTLTGRLVRVNRALAALVRRGETDLVGTEYVDLAADATDTVTETLDRIRTEPVQVAHLEHVVTGDGPERRVRATLAPVRDTHGRALYIFMQLQDVTAEQAAIEELRRSEERFRLLVEAVEDYAIFMLDPDGHIVSWNAGAQRIKLYTAEEIIGQHFRVFYPPEMQAIRHPENELVLALRDGHYEEEGWRVRRDGTRFWANVLITAVFDGEGRHVGFAKVTRDNSERRRLEQDRENALQAVALANAELESLNAQLSQAADDQAQFLAVTAHELRTPIGLLAGSAELFSRHGDELTGEERDELLTGMAGGAARLRRLVGDLLTAAKLQGSALELRPEPVRIGDVVARTLATVQASRSGAEILTRGPEDLVVETDSDRLAQMLENLVLNALDHGTAPVTVLFDRCRSHVQIEVTDSGAGVRVDLQPRLFERFATGRSRGGTGLGLYIVRQLARAQGGDATYETPTEQRPAGAFVVTLPLHPRTQPPGRLG